MFGQKHIELHTHTHTTPLSLQAVQAIKINHEKENRAHDFRRFSMIDGLFTHSEQNKYAKYNRKKKWQKAIHMMLI